MESASWELALKPIIYNNNSVTHSYTWRVPPASWHLSRVYTIIIQYTVIHFVGGTSVFRATPVSPGETPTFRAPGVSPGGNTHIPRTSVSPEVNTHVGHRVSGASQ